MIDPKVVQQYAATNQLQTFEMPVNVAQVLRNGRRADSDGGVRLDGGALLDEGHVAHGGEVVELVLKELNL